MNAAKRKYLLDRVDQITGEKLQALGKAHYVSVGLRGEQYDYNGNRIAGSKVAISATSTDADMKEAIARAGGIKYTAWKDVKAYAKKRLIDDRAQEYGDRPAVIANKKSILKELNGIVNDRTDFVRELCDQILVRAQDLKDEIVLGDEQDALNLMKAFEKS